MKQVFQFTVVRENGNHETMTVLGNDLVNTTKYVLGLTGEAPAIKHIQMVQLIATIQHDATA